MASWTNTLDGNGAVWRAESGTFVEWGPGSVVIVRPWPNPRAWQIQRVENAKWLRCPEAWTGFRIGTASPRWTPRPRQLVEQEAWATVPEPVRVAVEAARVKWKDWSALALIARCPGSAELAASVPLLAGALSVANFVRTKAVAQPLRSARRLLRLPDGMARWRKIAAWLGFEGSKSFVNLLRRIPVAVRWSVGDFDTLRTVWSDPLGRKRLCHAERVDIGVIRALAVAITLGELARLPSVLFDAAYAAGADPELDSKLQNTILAWRLLRPGRTLPAWSSPEKIEAERESLREVASQLYPMESAFRSPPSFPPPPYAGTSAIAPITSSESLIREGKTMQHCVGDRNWDRQARFRNGYAYTVTCGSERTTLWIQRSPAGKGGFYARDCRGPGNRPASQAALNLVSVWLAEHNRNTALAEAWWRQVERRQVPGPPEIVTLIGEFDVPR